MQKVAVMILKVNKENRLNNIADRRVTQIVSASKFCEEDLFHRMV